MNKVGDKKVIVPKIASEWCYSLEKYNLADNIIPVNSNRMNGSAALVVFDSWQIKSKSLVKSPTVSRFTRVEKALVFSKTLKRVTKTYTPDVFDAFFNINNQTKSYKRLLRVCLIQVVGLRWATAWQGSSRARIILVAKMSW